MKKLIDSADIIRIAPAATPRNGVGTGEVKPKRKKTSAKRARVNKPAFIKDWMEGVLSIPDMCVKFGVSESHLRRLAKEIGVERSVESHSQRMTQIKIAAAQVTDAVKAAATAPTMHDLIDAKSTNDAEAELAMKAAIVRSIAILNGVFAELEALSNPQLVENLKAVSKSAGAGDVAMAVAIDQLMDAASLSSRLKCLGAATEVQQRLTQMYRIAIGLDPTKPTRPAGGGVSEYEELLRKVWEANHGSSQK